MSRKYQMSDADLDDDDYNFTNTDKEPILAKPSKKKATKSKPVPVIEPEEPPIQKKKVSKAKPVFVEPVIDEIVEVPKKKKSKPKTSAISEEEPQKKKATCPLTRKGKTCFSFP